MVYSMVLQIENTTDKKNNSQTCNSGDVSFFDLHLIVNSVTLFPCQDLESFTRERRFGESCLSKLKSEISFLFSHQRLSIASTNAVCYLNSLKAASITVSICFKDKLASNSICTKPVDYWLRKSTHFGEVRVYMQRIHVSRQTV